jgi:hypothetical protein
MTGNAGQLVVQGIEVAGHAGEAGLHLIDAEKQERHAENHATDCGPSRTSETAEHAKHQQGQRQGAETDILPSQGQQPDTAGGAQVGPEQDGDPRRQLDQAGAEEGDGQQRHQRTGLHQHGGAHAEHQAFEGRGGTQRQQAFQLAAGQLAQPFLQALHAEQEQRQAGAQAKPAGTEPEAQGQQDKQGKPAERA